MVVGYGNGCCERVDILVKWCLEYFQSYAIHEWIDVHSDAVSIKYGTPALKGCIGLLQFVFVN